MLESLSPEQRAAFLLHDVFDYDYAEIARIVGTSEANARQLASRARRHVEERRPRFEPSSDQRDELADRFFAAARDGEVAALEALLAEDVELHGDGGGKVPALARMLRGRKRVARTLAAWARQGPRVGAASFRRVEINGQPGALVRDSQGRLITVMAIEIAAGEVRAVSSIVNPDKLRHIGPVADLRELLAKRDR